MLSGHRLVPEGIGHEPLLALLSDAGPHLTWSVVVVGNRVENCVPASDVLSLSLLTQPVRQVEWQAGADQPTGALGAPGAGTGRASNDPNLAASSGSAAGSSACQICVLGSPGYTAGQVRLCARGRPKPAQQPLTNQTTAYTHDALSRLSTAHTEELRPDGHQDLRIHLRQERQPHPRHHRRDRRQRRSVDNRTAPISPRRRGLRGQIPPG